MIRSSFHDDVANHIEWTVIDVEKEGLVEGIKNAPFSVIYFLNSNDMLTLIAEKAKVRDVVIHCKICGDEYRGEKLPESSLRCKCHNRYLYYENVQTPGFEMQASVN